MYFLTWMIVGLIAGWGTGRLLNSGAPEPVIDILMGIAGASMGGFVMRISQSPSHNGIVYSTLVAIMGAVVLTGLTGYATGRKRCSC